MGQNNDHRTHLIANTIRGLSMDAVQKANTGHPGLPMGMADVATILWSEFLKFNPSNPGWFNRDRFVLSGGHGSMLIYSLLHLFGYDLALEELKNFRQLGSLTPGHPEKGITPGVETTTGPLGQGLANAIGMAMAVAHLRSRFSPIGHDTFVMVGDGDLQEGISHEACSLAGHLKLDRLVVLFDSNEITIDGSTHLSTSDDIKKRFDAYNWHIVEADGHDQGSIRSAFRQAVDFSGKPTIIIFKTIIGYGSPNKAGTSSAHGSPLGVEEVRLSKQQLGISPEAFFIPAEIDSIKTEYRKRGQQLEQRWQREMALYANENPELFELLTACIKGEVSVDSLGIPYFQTGKSMATRSASGKVIEYLQGKLPHLFGGSADLTPSNNTYVPGQKVFNSNDYSGNYIHFGVREHAMAGTLNGIALHGGLLPFGGTFFVFSDYMRPAIRMAALMKQQVIFVFTHDSIGLGEDGPTHQPIEHLSSLRAMPGICILRPMDANETVEAWKIAIDHRTGPSCLILTRQNLPVMDPSLYPVQEAVKGAYVIAEDPGFDRIILAAGSEVYLAMEAKKILNDKGISVRIVSMFSMELFEEQEPGYRKAILPEKVVKRVAVEAGSSQSWYKYTGLNGKILGIDRFGESGPQEELFVHFGITSAAIVEAVMNL